MNITLADYAARNNISPSTVRSWIFRGKIYAIKSGSVWLIEENTPRPKDMRHGQENVIYPRTCKDCGAIFDGGPKALYCPECRVQRKRKWSADAYAKRKAKN